jgi:hypothetical protein
MRSDTFRNFFYQKLGFGISDNGGLSQPGRTLRLRQGYEILERRG